MLTQYTPESCATPQRAKCSLLQRRRRLNGPLNLDIKAVVSDQAPLDVAVLSDKYSLLEKLGQGSTGVVRRATRKADGKVVAVKMMRAIDPEHKLTMQKEFDLLRSITHPNIIQTYDFLETEAFLVLVLEFFGGVSLAKTVRRAPGQRLEEHSAKRLTNMLLQAVDYLHRRRIVHRDVKAANILVSEDLQKLKLIDFNTGRQVMEGGALTMTGTFSYMAPEALLGESPSEPGDVWACGLCLHFMLTGRLPLQYEQFASMTQFAEAVATRPVSLRDKPLCDVTAACKAMLRSCLDVRKAFRPAPMNLLLHEWFQRGRGAGASRRSRTPCSSRRATSCPP